MQVVNTKDLHIVMSMYNLIEYKNNFADKKNTVRIIQIKSKNTENDPCCWYYKRCATFG